MAEDLEDFKIDIAEIFGGSVSPPPKETESPEKPPRDISDEDQKVLKDYEEKKKSQGELAEKTSDLEIRLRAELEAKEKAIQEAYERGKAEAGAKKAEGDSGGDTKKITTGFLSAFDEFRLILFYKVSPIVGEKATRTMLVRSFEKARERFPDAFKNANWDDKGNLLEDGNLNEAKILENLSDVSPPKALAQLKEALRALLHLRLSAVQKGLGPQVALGLVKSMSARLQEIKGGHEPEILKALAKLLPSEKGGA